LFAVFLAFPAPGRSLSCSDAAEVVEQRMGLPGGLLHSIGTVESGNHSFAVDADGNGRVFRTAAAAIDFVRQGAEAARFVDVGCFQIDLGYHQSAFHSLDEAFDPLSNATAAARYLLSLRRGSSSWFEAVARYHSGQPDPGHSYALCVYALQEPIAMHEREQDRPFNGVRIIVPTAYDGPRTSGGKRAGGGGLPVVQTP
jgi:hypothetical protein